MPSRLYKYQKFDEYSASNIRNGTIWFSPAASFNDPFDCNLVVESPIVAEADFQRAYERELVRRSGAFLSMNAFEPERHAHPRFRNAITSAINDAFRDTRTDHRERRGVSCFAERVDNLLMWGHYASSHTGFCLEFDGECEPFVNAQRVTYASAVPQLNPLDLLDPAPPKGVFERALLLTKADCWAYEQEWRLVHAVASELVRYADGALVAIYLGCQVSSTNAKLMSEVARERGLPLYRMERVPREFTLASRAV